MVTAITGSGFGDEGKGKITDFLAEKADIVVRFQGGANAGHTIINDFGRFVLRLLPSGVFHHNVENMIASGVAFDADIFFSELEMLKEKGVKAPKILVSSRAQLLLPVHKLQDKLEEERLGKYKFGTTLSGIWPFYSDKFARRNIQISELYSDNLKNIAGRFCEDKNICFKAFYGIENAVSYHDLLNYLYDLKARLSPYLCDCPYYMNAAIKDGKDILLEGQLGSLRDIENGIYPYVTSSSPLAGFGSVSAGIPPYEITSVVSVVKAYNTSVGEGPLVGELFGSAGDALRRRGGDQGEFGANTGRPRRMAWFDCVSTRYGCMLQGATEIALTNLDVLGYLDRIPVCVSYHTNGKITKNLPQTYLLRESQPVYKYLNGWHCDISGCSQYNELPEAAKNYIRFIENQIGVPVSIISVGPKRNQTIFRNGRAGNKL